MKKLSTTKEHLLILEGINTLLINFLAEQISERGFPLNNNYGETSAAAAFSISQSKLEKIPLLIKAYNKRDKSSKDFHWEFNNSALQQISPSRKKLYLPLKFNMPFYRKVTNWILLRALVYFREKKTLKGHLIAFPTLLFQQGSSGVLYDSRLYRKNEISYQYHAFATSLLGEIYFETKNIFYKKRFLKALNYLIQISPSIKSFEKRGLRGRGQTFGYASAIHALAQGYKINKKEIYLSRIKMLLNHLKKYQRKDGSFPLVLQASEKKLETKNYKNKRYPGWESYNRYYDYTPFLSLYLSKTIKIIKS